MTEPEAKVEQWLCAGVRASSDNKRCVAWEDPTDGHVYLYADKPSYICGATYEVKITRKADGVYRGAPRFISAASHDEADQDKLNEWRIRERDAEHELARRARERKAKAEDALGDAMQPLFEYARGCRNSSQRAALISDVIYRLGRGW